MTKYIRAFLDLYHADKVSTYMLSSTELARVQNVPFVDNFTKKDYHTLHCAIYHAPNNNNGAMKHCIWKTPNSTLNKITIFEWCALLLVSLMTIRVGLVLIQPSDGSVNVNLALTLLSSLFEHIGANRLHAEVTVLIFSLYALVTLVLIFLVPQTRQFFHTCIIYCNQFIFTANNKNNNRKKVSISSLPTEDLEQLVSNSCRRLLRFHPLFNTWLTVNVTLTNAFFLYLINPRRNNVLWFWSPNWYWALMLVHNQLWSLWTLLGSFNTFYVFIYFIIQGKIAGIKFRHELDQLSAHVAQSNHCLSINVRIERHLRRQERLLAEIAHCNQFWRWYLTYSKLLCTLFFCFTLYCSTMTRAAPFAKRFFATCSLPILAMMLVNCVVGSGGNRFAASLYRKWTQIWSRHCRRLNRKIKFKVN